MDNTLGGVKKRVRSLVGDPMGDFATDAYLVPLINQCYEHQTTYLMSETDSSFDEWIFDVPNVPSGTTNLGPWQSKAMKTPNGNVAGPLLGLVDPIIVEWKISGQPDDRYVEATRTGKLPNVSPAAPFPPFQMQWEWLHYIINVTPLSYPCDIRVRGEFSPPTLTADTDELIIHPRMGTATSYGTAALIGVERKNQNFIDNYGGQAQDVLELIANYLVKNEQGTTTRIGRTGGNLRRGLGAGFR